MGDTKRMRKRRAKLWTAQNGRCYWCEEPMIRGGRNGGRLPKAYATIDHLRSRYHKSRWDEAGAKMSPRTVLACSRCNNNRGKKENTRIPIKELWRRSNCRPRKWYSRWWRMLKWRVEYVKSNLNNTSTFQAVNKE